MLIRYIEYVFVCEQSARCPCFRLMLGFMSVTAFLSMWISNTATTAMLIPIVHAVLLKLEEMMNDRIGIVMDEEGIMIGRKPVSIAVVHAPGRNDPTGREIILPKMTFFSCQKDIDTWMCSRSKS